MTGGLVFLFMPKSHWENILGQWKLDTSLSIGYNLNNTHSGIPSHTLPPFISTARLVRNLFSSTLAVIASCNASTDSHERYDSSSREPANMLVNIPRIQGRLLWKRCENTALESGTKYARRFDYGGTGFQRLCQSIDVDLTVVIYLTSLEAWSIEVSFPTWLLALCRRKQVSWTFSSPR